MFELSLLCPEERVDVLSDALDALDALSVSVEDADAQTPAEQALFGEPGMPPPKDGWQRSRMVALFAQESGAQEAATLLQAQDFFDGCRLLGIQAVADQDWVRLTQSQFAPVEVTSDFWIVPTWHEPPAQAKQIIRLDPGLAFGTGTHPTTRMCLRWIARNPVQGQRVLDYGCGSGILAIAAKKLGAKEVVGVDIDHQAIIASQFNAEQNQVSAKFYMATDYPEAQADIVVANILSSALSVLAPALASACKPGGLIALSGILREQADQVSGIYAEWFEMNAPVFMDSWVLLSGTRK